MTGAPSGAAYDWFQRGKSLLGAGDAAAAVQVLQHAAAAEPQARSIQEALGRALFDAGQHAAASDVFGGLIVADPSDDYARYALGMALRRLDRLTEALEQLVLASVMRPENASYAQALRETRATLSARRRVHLPETGPVG